MTGRGPSDLWIGRNWLIVAGVICLLRYFEAC